MLSHKGTSKLRFVPALYELLAIVLLSANLFHQSEAAVIDLLQNNVTTDVVEWTAMGDSYAAGIGAGNARQIFDGFCYRYDEAYPVVLNANIQPQPSKFNFVACSGDVFAVILQKQFLDQPLRGRPEWGERPQFVTLSMGGNDIGFKELVTVCIYSIRLFTIKNCAEVIADSQRIVNSRDFVNGAVNVIAKALRMGTQRSGPDFKVYVTGYAQFFNDQTPQCNDVSFKARMSFWERQYLTTERRRTMNQIAQDLNTALRTAVARASIGAPGRVLFVNYDAQFNGHRFCDREEPNPGDPNTWFFTLGTNEDEAATGDFLNSIRQISSFMSGRSNQTISDSDFFQLISEAAGDDERKLNAGVGVYRVFHPKSAGHRAIEGRLRDTLLADGGGSVNRSGVGTS